MSETDDTDELILIPPDFFFTEDLEEPYLSAPYYNVVDSLISQVNYLESRINIIENKSDHSVRSNSINYPVDITPKVELMSGIRKYNSSDDINKVTRDGYFESTQSTPQKPQTRFKLNSYSSASPENDNSQRKGAVTSIRSNFRRFKGNSKNYEQKNESTKEVLQEIDQYIHNMQQSKKNMEAHNHSAKSDSSSKNSLNLKDLDYMLQKVDLQNKEFEKQDATHRNLPKQCESYVSDFGHNMQSKLSTKDKLNHTVRSQFISTSEGSTYNESSNDKTESVSSSSESTQLTALPNVNRLQAGGSYYGPPVGINTNDTYAQKQSYLNQKVPGKTDIQNVKRNILQNAQFQNREGGRQDHRLLSLSHLWNRGDAAAEYMTKEERLLEKLEEEKLRRQHCEQLIQHLQSKTLELQEKLAVAVQVDEAKDNAILRFHSSWEQVSQRLQNLTKDRNNLEEEIANIQSQNAEDIIEVTKKIAHFENEASKALAIAQTSQERTKDLESQVCDMTTEINSLKAKLKQCEDNYKCEVDKNKELLEQIEQKARELCGTNNSLVTVQNEIITTKRAISACQTEITSLRSQNTHLEKITSEKDDIIKSMERHHQKLFNEIDTHKKIEKDLQQELNRAKELSEKNKLDLRNFYQDQVEIVVRDKLREFQSQLDKAESSLQDELKKRELTIAKSAANHIQQISDKHSLEIKLIEEKHSEEVRLYKMKLSQSQQCIENLQDRLDQQHQKKSDMAKQLHKVMEAQWLEALKIINNGKSPIVNDQDITINQLNVLKTKSYSNLEEVLSMDVANEHRDCEQQLKNQAIIPPLNLGASTSSTQDNNDNCPFSLNMETPLTSRLKTKQQIELELQKYVQMLLNKQPGNPIEVNKIYKDISTQEMPTWQSVSQEEKMASKSKDRKQKKPWK